MDLNGKVAVITGAGSGLGRAIALELARHKTQLALVGRTLAKLQAVAAEAGEHSAKVNCYSSDLSRDEDIEQLRRALETDFGEVDVLVHSAGVTVLGPVATTPVRHLDCQLRINVRAPYALTQALLPALKNSRGQLIFLNSTVGLEARAEIGAYAASKHALRAIADSLRSELNGLGVRVLSVYLGRTATPMQEQTFAAEQRKYHPEALLQPEDVASMLVHALTLPRTAEVTEIRMRPMAKSY